MKLRYVIENYLANHRPDSGSDRFFIFKYNTINNIEHYINKQIQQAVEKSGVNLEITSHIMRHSFASNLIDRGVDVYHDVDCE